MFNHIIIPRENEPEADDELGSILHEMLSRQCGLSDADMNSLHAFATRCLSSGKGDLIQGTLNLLLTEEPYNDIRDLCLQYGARLDPSRRGYLRDACRCGSSDAVRQAIQNGAEVERTHMVDAVYSCDADTIKLIADLLGNDSRAIDPSLKISFYDATVPVCELLIKLGVLRHGRKYVFHSIRSIPVLQFLLDHDIVDIPRTFAGIVDDAALDYQPFFDVLRYAVDHAHMTVPTDILAHLHESTLCVIDYLIASGADVNARNYSGDNALSRSPLAMRYWMDKGLKIVDCKDACWRAMSQYIGNVDVLEIMMTLFHIDEKTYGDNGKTLLHLACEGSHRKTVEMLLRRGADVNAVNDDENTAMVYITDENIEQLLRQHRYFARF